jgi:hypothetical protein
MEDLKKTFINWTSGNETIDNFIQEKQSENPSDIIFEWIPYNQFFNINKVNKYDFSTIYSAKWKNGPLYWDKNNRKYKRHQDIDVILKYLHNLQNTDELLNEVNFFISLFLELFYNNIF